MIEATTSVPWELCEAVVRALTFSCDLMPLKDIVLQIIDRVGGKRESVYGLKVVNQCLRYELLELIRSDGTKVQFSTDCEHPTVCAAPVNPAEAIWVEPREDGCHFVRRPATPPAPPAELPQFPATATPPAGRQLSGGPEPSQSPQAQQLSPATPPTHVEPGRDVDAADVPVQGTQVKPGGPQLPSAASKPTSAANVEDQGEAAAAAAETAGTQPESNWSVETFLREWVITRPAQQTIVKALSKLYGDNIAAVLNGFTSTKPFQAANLRRDLKKLMQDEARPGRPVRDSDVPSSETCGRFLTAWHEFRTKQRARNR